MIITAIEKRKKFINLVCIDNEYTVEIDREVLCLNRVKVGMNIDDDELHYLILESDKKRAKDKALYYLGKRDYSKKELLDKIKMHVTSQAAEFAVDKMVQLGLVNDEVFARKYAHDLIYLKKFSKFRVQTELIKKGIDRELADSVLEEFELDYCNIIYEILDKKYKNKLTNEKDRRRTIAALQRLGYKWEDINSAIKQYMSDKDCEVNIDVL